MKRLSPQNKIGIVRWTLVVLLTFFISHYLSYGKLPLFSDNYTFPWTTFIVVGIYGLFICQANTIIYRWLNKRVPFAEGIVRRLGYQFMMIWGATILIFTFLQVSINLVIFERELTFYSFSFYLLICLFISTFEGLAYTSLSLYVYFNAEKGRTPENSYITIKTNGKLIKFDFDEVSHVHSEKGIVTLTGFDGKKYLTQFSALHELEKLLPGETFFRVNRQYLIHKKLVKSIEEGDNRKLRLYLAEEYADSIGVLPISRYRNSQFKKWLKA